MQLDRDNRDALSELVDVYAQTNQLGEARRLIDSRLATAPDDTGLRFLAARTYATSGDHPTAEQMLKKVIAQDSTNLSAYGMLGQIYIADRRLESARLEYEKAVAKEPTPVAANTIVAMILEAQHKRQDAEKRYLRVLEIDPNAVVAANNLPARPAGQESRHCCGAGARTESRHRSTDRRHAGWAYKKKLWDRQSHRSKNASIAMPRIRPPYHLEWPFRLGLRGRGKRRAGARAPD